MAIKVATAFVEVVPKVRNMGGVLQKAFAGVDAGSLLGRKIANGVNGSLGKYVKIGAALAGVKVLGKKIAGITGSVINMGNEWGRTTSILKVAVGTSNNWQKSLEATHKAANNIGVPIKDMVESASRLVQLAPKTIPDYKTSLKFSTLLQKNLIATGASGAETASVMRQVTQALGKGIVNGDELNSIMENSPMIAQMLAKHLNVDVGKLKELGKAGQISGDALRDAIFENADKINKQFAMMPITADRAFTAVKNDWEVAANQTATKISQALGYGLASISRTGIITTFANSLKGIIPLAISVGTAVSSVFIRLAPILERALSPDKVEAFLQPLTALFDKLGSMSVDQLVNGLKMLGFAGAMTFSGILKGADSFLGRIPIIGGALVKLKNGLVAIGGAAGKMAGSLLEASGAGLSKLGSGLQTIAKQIGRFDAGSQSIKLFAQAVSGVDFGKMGKDGAQLVDILNDMQRGNLNVRDSVMQLANAMREAEANGTKIPAEFKNAFKLLEDEANASCNTIKARFADMVNGFQAISKQASGIKLFNSKVTLDEAAKVRATITNIVSAVTGIKIPDFLTQPIGSMVASAVNTLNRLGGVVNAVFSPISTKASAAFAPLANVAKTVGAGIKSSLNSAISAACSKIPMLGRAVSVVGSAFDGLKAHGGAAFKSVGVMALNAAGGGIKMFGNAVKSVGSCLGAVGKAASALGINAAIMSGVTAGFSAMMHLDPSQFASSVQNMATNVANGIKNLAANIPQAAKALATAIPQIAQTITKCAPQIINGLAQAFSQLAPVIMRQLPSLMRGVQQLFQSLVAQLPSIASWLTNGFASLFQGACKTLPSVLGGLSKALLAAIGGMAQALPQALPKMVAGLSSLFQGLAAQIPQITQQLAQMMPQVVQGLSQGLIANLPQLMQGIVQMVTSIAQALPTLLPALLRGVVQLIAALAQQLPTLIVQLVAALPAIIGNIAVALVNCLPVLLAGIGQLIGGIIAGLPQAIGALIGALPGILQAIWDTITGLLKAGWDSIGAIFKAGGAILKGIWDALWNGISGLFSSIWNGIKGAAQAVWNWLTSTLNSICQGISSAWNACWNGISSFFNSIWNGIKGFAQGIWNGIKSALGSVLNSISNTWRNMWNGIKSFFSNIWNGIKSGAKAGIDAVFNFVTGIKDRILGFFGGAGQWLLNAGRAILEGLLKGLKAAWDGICNFVGGIGSWIAKHKGPISYDKKLLIPAGNAIMQGFSKGLGESWQGVQKQVAGFSKQSGNWFDNTDAIRLKTTVVPPDGGWNAQQNQLAKVATNYDIDASQHGLTKQDVYEAFDEVMGQGVTLKLNGRGGEVMAGVLAKPMNNELNRLAKLGR